MDRKTLGILEELDRYVPSRSRQHVVENRARNVIASAVNLMELIHETYSPDEANVLTKRLLSAIQGGDEGKFVRQIRKIEDRRGE